MSANIIQPGDTQRLSVVITDIDGVAADPSTLTFTMDPPSGNSVAYVYGTDVEVVRDSLGTFYVDYPVTVAGTHRFKWVSTGENAAVEEGYFISHALKVASV